MISSFTISVLLLILRKEYHFEISTHHALLVTIAVTTVCWLLTAYFGPQTDRRTLVQFYNKVRPFGPGWRPIREEAGAAAVTEATRENVPLALLGWSTGCAVIWAALFAVGNFLYGRFFAAGMLMAVAVISSLSLLWVMGRLWENRREA